MYILSRQSRKGTVDIFSCKMAYLFHFKNVDIKLNNTGIKEKLIHSGVLAIYLYLLANSDRTEPIPEQKENMNYLVDRMYTIQ